MSLKRYPTLFKRNLVQKIVFICITFFAMGSFSSEICEKFYVVNHKRTENIEIVRKVLNEATKPLLAGRGGNLSELAKRESDRAIHAWTIGTSDMDHLARALRQTLIDRTAKIIMSKLKLEDNSAQVFLNLQREARRLDAEEITLAQFSPLIDQLTPSQKEFFVIVNNFRFIAREWNPTDSYTEFQVGLRKENLDRFSLHYLILTMDVVNSILSHLGQHTNSQLYELAHELREEAQKPKY